MSRAYETELSGSRTEIAAVLSGVVDGLLAGSIRLGEDVTVDTPEELDLEIELETEDDEVSLELELEWPRPTDDESMDAAAEEGDAEHAAPVGAADGSQAGARFEVFRDGADEWRWRLRHRNGNIIATSGEGYRRRQGAQKGLRSVVQNAPGAEVTEERTD